MTKTASGSIADVFQALGADAPTPSVTSHYSVLLEGALADRVLDADEVDALVQKATDLGLDSVTLGSLHRGHFDGVIREAWSDGVLTEDERADILLLAELLGIDDDSLNSALQGDSFRSETLELSAGQPTLSSNFESSPATEGHTDGVGALSVGGVVVLTGEMTIERNQVEARILALGFAVGANVTKKTVLVIAADPYTQSGKAKKALSRPRC